jgi:hypothetical protein
MCHAMKPAPPAKPRTHQDTTHPSPKKLYRRLRDKADAQLAAAQYQAAEQTLREIQRLQRLYQVI